MTYFEVTIVGDRELLDAIGRLLSDDGKTDAGEFILGTVRPIESAVDALDAPLSGKAVKQALEALSIAVTLSMGAEWIGSKIHAAAEVTEPASITEPASREVIIIINGRTLYEGPLSEMPILRLPEDDPDTPMET